MEIYSTHSKLFSLESDESLFNRALAINKGVIESKTPYFAIFDVDCLTKKKNLSWPLIY